VKVSVTALAAGQPLPIEGLQDVVGVLRRY